MQGIDFCDETGDEDMLLREDGEIMKSEPHDNLDFTVVHESSEGKREKTAGDEGRFYLLDF